MKNQMKTLFSSQVLTKAAAVGGLYTALNLLASMTPLGTLIFGPIQIRISEALTVLPYLMPEAIPGLTIGCFLTNLLGIAMGLGGGVLDLIFGTLSTFLAACLTFKCRSAIFAPLPPVMLNALIIAGVLSYTAHMPYWPWVLSIGIGQILSCYVLGLPLLRYLQKRKWFFISSRKRIDK